MGEGEGGGILEGIIYREREVSYTYVATIHSLRVATIIVG